MAVPMLEDDDDDDEDCKQEAPQKYDD